MSDFNDFPPVFVNISSIGEDGNPVIKVNIIENVTAGAEIVTVQATDRDIGDNAILEYMITSGNDDGFFQSNQKAGQIRLAPEKRLDYDTKTSHRMQVSLKTIHLRCDVAPVSSHRHVTCHMSS